MGVEIGTLILAGVAVFTSVASVLLLAFRVGKLTGSTEARMASMTDESGRQWQAIGRIDGKLDRHIEAKHQPGR